MLASRSAPTRRTSTTPTTPTERFVVTWHARAGRDGTGGWRLVDTFAHRCVGATQSTNDLELVHRWATQRNDGRNRQCRSK